MIKKEIKKEEKKENVLFIAGYINEGVNKGKKIAIRVNNLPQMNPVEPIFEQYPEFDLLVVGKDSKKVQEFFKNLIK